MNVTPINKRSSFKILIALDNYSGEDFRLSFYTAGTVQKRFVCSYINGAYTNCQYIDDYHVLCSFPANTFNLGILKCEICYSFYDELSESNYFKIVSNEIVTARVNNEDSHIEITNDKTGKIITPEFAIYLLGPILRGEKGEQGEKGDPGEKGDTGIGVPEGGTTGQVLTKASDNDYDAQWETSTTGVSSVNGKTGSVNLNASDVGALPDNTHIPSALSEMTDDDSHRTVSDSEKSSWGGKQDAINDLEDIRSGAAAGATALQEETDPTVPAWAKTPNKPTYEYNEVGIAIANESGITIASLTPNVYHKWGEVASLTILALGALTDATKMVEYMIEFQSGSTPTVLSLPNDITWLNGENPTSNISANKKYQISIVNNLGVYAEF